MCLERGLDCGGQLMLIDWECMFGLIWQSKALCYIVLYTSVGGGKKQNKMPEKGTFSMHNHSRTH